MLNRSLSCCAQAVLCVVVLGSAGAEPPTGLPMEPIEKRAREGVVRLSHPSHHAECRWGAGRHDDGLAPRGGISAGSTTLVSNGPTANRIDLVIVGDGYTSADLGAYAGHAQRGVDELFSTAPFDRYEPLFNVHRVDVVSNETGVDNDPVQGVSRDTALDMSFWCGGTERLLCVSVGKAVAAASNAPDWDQIFAVANSTKYGGAGYPSSDVGTYSGANASAPQVAIHELGHALGNLADEYTYGGPSGYSGPEPTAKNVSIYTADEQVATGRKWHRWIGESDPAFDGLVGTYEGGNYSSTGIYRPSSNSMMRNLGRDFNLPSAEALIVEFWKIVSPIDSHTPASSPLGASSVVSVDPAAPFLSVRWYVDEVFVASGPQINLAGVDRPTGECVLRVEVTDETPLVRDEAARALYMTQAVEWVLAGIPADVTGDGRVDSVDLTVLLAAWGTGEVDLNGDQTTDAADMALMLAAWG